MNTVALTTSSTLGLAVMSAVAVGAILLILLGRRLTRPFLVVLGTVAGAGIGTILAPMLGSAGWVGWCLILGCAIAAGILTNLMFRLWMGISMACALALIVPAAVIIWQGVPRPAVELPHLETRPATLSVPEIPHIDMTAGRSWWSRFSQRHENDVQSIRAWWAGLSPSTQQTLQGSVAVGAAVGLLLGLLMPTTTSGLQAALVGSVLLLLSVRGIWLALDAQSLVNAGITPRLWLVGVGLITVLGMGIQGVGRRASADKSKEKNP